MATEPHVYDRAELVEYILNMNRHAKRQPYVIAKLSNDPPTSWDRAHAQLDAPLDALLLLDMEP